MTLPPRLIRALCASSWAALGLVKVAYPDSIQIRGLHLADHWSSLFGAFELVVACLIWDVKLADLGRCVAIALITLLLVGVILTPDQPSCGCLGSLETEPTTRPLLVGLLMTLHGVDLLAARPRCRELG